MRSCPGTVEWLMAAGCNAVHTLDLPNANRTTDAQIITIADEQKRILITKDADFVDSHTLHQRPARLLLISTGNISNAELAKLMVPLIPSILREFLGQFLCRAWPDRDCGTRIVPPPRRRSLHPEIGLSRIPRYDVSHAGDFPAS